MKDFPIDIGVSQAKYKLFKIKNGKGTQGAYYLPLDLEKYLLEKQLLIETELPPVKEGQQKKSEANVKKGYLLKSECEIVLGPTLIKIIGSQYANSDNRALFIHTESKEGKDKKFQLIKAQTEEYSKIKDDSSFKWFCDLYEKNVEDAILHTLVDENKLTFDVEISEKILNPLQENSKMANMNHQKIFYGVPGSGKSYEVDNELSDLGIIKKIDEGYFDTTNKSDQTIRVVFHPDYSNSDFIGQIYPRVVETEEPREGEVSQDESMIPKKIVYEFLPGPFTKILTKAYLNSNKNYALIIEEINRGNAAAIFGELFQLLDRIDDNPEILSEYKYDKGWSSYCINNDFIINEIAKNYARTDISPFIDKESFEKYKSNIGVRLPPNLSLIATMNTSDQNVFTLDNAFQRRWEMELILNELDKSKPSQKNQAEAIIDDNENPIEWYDFVKTTNNIISKISEEMGLSSTEDKQLGCWFVKAEKSKDGIYKIDRNVFANKVLKYIWDDALKFNRKDFFNLNDKSERFNSLPKIIKYIQSEDNKITEVFLPTLVDSIKSTRVSGKFAHIDFSQLGISKDTELFSVEEGSISCKVAEDNKVFYKDEIYANLGELTKKHFSKSKLRVDELWSYEGKTLKEIKNGKE